MPYDDKEKQALIEERRELRIHLQRLYDQNAQRSETKPIVERIDRINQQLKGYGVSYSEY